MRTLQILGDKRSRVFRPLFFNHCADANKPYLSMSTLHINSCMTSFEAGLCDLILHNNPLSSVLVAQLVKVLAGLTYVFTKGRFDRVRDQLTKQVIIIIMIL